MAIDQNWVVIKTRLNVLHEVHTELAKEVPEILDIPSSVGVQDNSGEDDDLLEDSDEGDEEEDAFTHL